MPIHTHGHTIGRKRSPTYRQWLSMIGRCTLPSCINYPKYGGAGITVCERWRTFANFLEDMGEKPSPTHSIDRIKGTLGYGPENCRWATRLEQAQNQKPRTLRLVCKKNLHPLVGANLGIDERGGRFCRECSRTSARLWWRKTHQKVGV